MDAHLHTYDIFESKENINFKTFSITVKVVFYTRKNTTTRNLKTLSTELQSPTMMNISDTPLHYHKKCMYIVSFQQRTTNTKKEKR